MQMLFGSGVSVAVQDPCYPVYVDSSVIMGSTGGYTGEGFAGVEYMRCTPANSFFPDFSKVSGWGWLVTRCQLA